ncbi:MAG: MarR family transcriptional regulator [Halopseudomonas sp.]|uniref:MarR family winged helix-turn-helix transcriptional regulator n=1 Tax=Halopseudomonas sp. TaxID=2901191 RepID=UPI003002121E
MDKAWLPILVADVHRLVRKAFIASREADGLTQEQFRTLVHLSLRQGIRQVELAEILEIKPITLTRVLDQLAAAGLIERRPAPTDRRAHQLFLTDAAKPHLHSFDLLNAEISQRMTAGLSDMEVEQLLRLLRHVHEQMGQ